MSDQRVNIAVINKANTSLGYDLGKMVAAAQSACDKFFSPPGHWGKWCALRVADAPVKGDWSITFMDDADVPGAEGYHEAVDRKAPSGKVFVKTTLAAGDDVAVTFTHELFEILLNPYTTMMAMNPNDGTIFALEACDAVEEISFEHMGIPISDFVTPSYFMLDTKSSYDLLGKLSSPFSLAPGGYSAVIQNGRIEDIFASHDKRAKFQTEDRREHRTTLWKRDMQEKMAKQICLAEKVAAEKATRAHG